MKWNRRFRGLTMFVLNFGVGSLEQSVELGRLLIFDFLGNSLLLRPLFRSQIFKFCCDIQGSHLIGYLRVFLIIDQSECLICFSLCTELTLSCTELTLFCTELPENCICYNQSKLSNFSMYIINEVISQWGESIRHMHESRYSIKTVFRTSMNLDIQWKCIYAFLLEV